MPIRRARATVAEATESALDSAARRQGLETLEALERGDNERLQELLLRDDLGKRETRELDARIENYKRRRRVNRLTVEGIDRFERRWVRKSPDPVWLTAQRERAEAELRSPAMSAPHTLAEVRSWYVVRRLIALGEQLEALYPFVDWEGDDEWEAPAAVPPRPVAPRTPAPSSPNELEPTTAPQPKRRARRFGVVAYADLNL